MSADLATGLTAVGSTISTALLADEVDQHTAVDTTLAMVLPEAPTLGDSTTAWMCHQVFVECFNAIDRGATRAEPAEWVESVRGLSSGARVAGALSMLSGYDDETVAQLVSRPVSDAQRLIGQFPARPEPAAAPWPEPEPIPTPPAPPLAVDPEPSPASEIPPAPPPMAAPSPPLEAVTPQPTTASPSAEQAYYAPPGATRPPRRVRRGILIAVGVGMLVALLVVGAVALSNRTDDPAPTAGGANLGPSSATARTDPSPGCDTSAEARPDGVQEIDSPHRGLERSYRLSAPSTDPDNPNTPTGGLIVDLTDIDVEVADHVAETTLDDTAVSDGWTVLTPSPLGDSAPQWNVAADVEDPDDIGFVSAAVADVEQRVCVDMARIIVLGVGAGAHLGAEVVCSSPATYAGLVMVAGATRPNDCDASSTSVSALFLSGDQVFPLDGGRGDAFPDLASLRPGSLYDPPDARLALSQWATAANCDTGVQAEENGFAPVEYDGCDGGIKVVALTLEGEHGWHPAAHELLDDMMRDAVLPATDGEG